MKPHVLAIDFFAFDLYGKFAKVINSYSNIHTWIVPLYPPPPSYP